MSNNTQNFRIINTDPIIANHNLNTELILEVVVEANNYIIELNKLFKEIDFDLFEALGQRNLSGVIGEIFSRFFVNKFNDFIINPHPDGRPDILHLSNENIHNYYHKQCFTNIDGKSIPIKSKLSPFPYDGIETKCTIGSPKNNYKLQLENNTGKKNFEIGMPRIDYLSDLIWWAHHTHSRNLFGLYYDYYQEEANLPQILAVFYSDLHVDSWAKVSLGNPDSKKTSNTSLNSSGKNKMKQNCLLVIDNIKYIENLKSIGVLL